jgi:hypothetical protein
MTENGDFIFGKIGTRKTNAQNRNILYPANVILIYLTNRKINEMIIYFIFLGSQLLKKNY